MAQKRLRLTDLQSGANFIPRHIGPRDDDITSMLKEFGAKSLDDLIAKVVPEDIRTTTALDLPPALSERNALSDLRRMGDEVGMRHRFSTFSLSEEPSVVGGVVLWYLGAA